MFVQGQVYRRQDIHRQFGGQSQAAIRRVALYGDPDSRIHNLKLVRAIPTGAPNPGVEEVVSNRVPEVDRPELSKGR